MQTPRHSLSSADPVQTCLPGPRSLALHRRDSAYYIKGSPAQEVLLPLAFLSAEGDFIVDADGNRYLNFAAGLNIPCGPSDSAITAAAARACDVLQACEDYTTPARVSLSECLARIMPFQLGGVQYFSSGTEAVEAGLRFMQIASGGSAFVAIEGAYHGKTAGAVALESAGTSTSQAIKVMHVPFQAACSLQCNTTCACAAPVIGALRDTLSRSGSPLAGVVVECIQGNAGVRVPAPSLIGGLTETAKLYGGLMMADEILTGLGRSGLWWAFEHFGITPDVVAIGKGLGNGFPISATVIAERHSRSVRSLEGGTSFGGNPVSCAAACSTLEALKTRGLLSRAAEIGDRARKSLERLRKYPVVKDVRCFGALIGIEFRLAGRDDGDNAPVPGLYRAAAERGLLTTPTRGALRLTPPLTISDAALDRAAIILEEAIRATVD